MDRFRSLEGETMRYHNITKDDMLNGDGLRVVLWVAGCTHKCKNCQNPITWDIHGGIEFDEAARKEIEEEMEKSYISGLTLSGGDPLHPENRKEVTELAKSLKKKYPDKTIWMYTGFSWDEVDDLPIMAYVDVVVDGEYVDALRDVQLHWKGSSNQRVIDVAQTRQQGRVVLWA